jgi:hypothetical protein
LLETVEGDGSDLPFSPTFHGEIKTQEEIYMQGNVHREGFSDAG